MRGEMKVMKRIRENCLRCCGDSPKEVKYCPLTDCPLWPLRFGRRPKAAIRRLGKDGERLLDESNFKEGAIFVPDKKASESES